jgi:hypothetical protein
MGQSRRRYIESLSKELPTLSPPYRIGTAADDTKGSFFLPDSEIFGVGFILRNATHSTA